MREVALVSVVSIVKRYWGPQVGYSNLKVSFDSPWLLRRFILLSSLAPAPLCSNYLILLSKSQFRKKRSRADAIISVHHPPPPTTHNFSKLVEWWFSLSFSSQTKWEIFTWISEWIPKDFPKKFPNNFRNYFLDDFLYNVLNNILNESNNNVQNDFVNDFVNFFS